MFQKGLVGGVLIAPMIFSSHRRHRFDKRQIQADEAECVNVSLSTLVD